jgi:eukaryotic-like serine/threonine-protein kinase
MSTMQDRLQAALADRYRIERQLGAGGMAIVFLATDLRHQRQVALKVLRQELASAIGTERFIREIRLAARLQHPNILQLYDSGEADGLLFYVMPYIAGESLRHRLASGPIPVPETITILRDVADALAYAHGEGLVHRDVKPDNVMLSGRHALVADFGVAKAVGVSASQGITGTGAAIGTPAYMAPEQIDPTGPIDHRADLYAFGVMAYELIAGHPPFQADDVTSMLAQHLAVEPPPIVSASGPVPAVLAGIVMQCLAKRAADRPRSAEEVLRQLELFTTPVDGMAKPITRPRSHHRTAALPWAAVLVAVAGTGWLVMPRFTRHGIPPLQLREITHVGNVVEADISPDGQFLAYVSKDDSMFLLDVQDLRTGTILRLATTPDLLFGVNWSPDGLRLLVGDKEDSAGPVHIYSRTGGAPRRVATGFFNSRWTRADDQLLSFAMDWHGVGFVNLNGSPGQYSLRFRDTLTWLMDVAEHPRGNVFAIAMTDERGLRSRIWSFRVDSAQRHKIGVIDTLTTQPLLLEDSGEVTQLRWSQDGQWLFYVARKQGTAELRRVRVDRNTMPRGRPETLFGGLEWFNSLTLSGDGNVYYVKGNTFSNLWLGRQRGGTWQIQSLTTGTTSRTAPAISPDGQRIAFLKTIDGRGDVYLLPATGGEETQLTHLESVVGQPAWSRDGRTLAFGYRANGALRVATIAPEDPRSLRVFDRTELSNNGGLTWSPGARILYEAPDLKNLNLLDPLTGAVETLLRPDTVVGWLHQARYSPDARNVAVYWVRGQSSLSGLYVIDVATRTTRPLWLNAGSTMSPLGWSPDGGAILAAVSGGRDLWSLSAKTGTRHSVAAVAFRFGDYFMGSQVGETAALQDQDYRGDVWVLQGLKRP